MKTLVKYSIANLRRNKKRTIMTIIGVALTAALLVAITGMAASFHYMLIDSAIASFGDYHQMFEAVPGDKLKYIENAENVKSVFYSYLVDERVFDSRPWYLESSMAYPSDVFEPIYDVPDRSPDSKYNVFVKYKDLDMDTVATTELHIRQNLGDHYNVRDNVDLMVANGYLSKNAKLIISSLALIVYGVLIIASIIIIRNSFYISVTERTRQYGILMSVGARPRQIRQLVYLDALFIWAIAIVAGLALGVIAHFALVQTVNALFNPQGAAPMRLIVLPFSVILVAVLSAVVVFLSSASSAFIASHQTPISAIRGSKDIKIKDKKYKTSKTAQSFWGIGGVIASKNLKRSRKKYHTTVLSIVVSVALFIGLSTFMTYINRLVEIQFPNSDASFIVYGANPEVYRQILEHTAYDQAVYYIQAQGKPSQTSDSGLYRPYNILIANDEYFQKYANEVGIEDVNSSELAILNDSIVESGHYSRVTDYKAGDTITLGFIDFLYSEEGYYVDNYGYDLEFKIGAVTDAIPFGQDTTHAITIVVSEKYQDMQKIVGENNYRNGFYSGDMYINPGEHSRDISDYIDNLKESGGEKYIELNYADLAAQMQTVKNLILLLEIFTYGFIIVLSLIGVTNIFNTITTNVELRAKEFAILKSVGMTEGEFRRMIRVESLMYTTRALVIGIPIGLLISYGVYRVVFDGGVELGYILPWPAILTCVVLVGFLIWGIMAYSVKQVNKQNIIDTIRNDSI